METKKLTWRDQLARERGVFLGGNYDAGYNSATTRMQEKYPGNYIVEEFYNPKIQTWDLRLKFATPEDETWFILKNE